MTQDIFSKLFKLISLMLILQLALLQTATALLFFMGIPVTEFHFPLSFIGTMVIIYFISTEKNSRSRFQKIFFFSLLMVIVIIFFSIMISIKYYDFSWDGQAYHQEAIIQLKEKWNPAQRYLSAFTPMADVCNYYSRGIETLQSSVYAFTDRIESGKATNFILLLSGLFYSASFFIEKCNFSVMKSTGIGLLLVYNPVFVSQAFTFYIDAQIFFLYLILIISAISIFMSADKSDIMIYFSSVVLLLPAKFIAVPTTGVFIIAFLVILFMTRKFTLFKNILFISAVSSVIGFCVIGYQPYVTNTINHGSPFFPFAGRGSGQGPVLVDQSPVNFPGKNRVEKLLISVFSGTENIQKIDKHRIPRLKIPFTLKESEFQLAWDQRIGGFGPFYSGILLLSVALLMIILNKLNKMMRLYLIFIIAVILVSVFLISEAWWLRYVPQLWLLTFVVVVFSELTEKSWPQKFIVYAIYLFLFLNVTLISAKTLRWNALVTKSIDAQIEKITNENKPLIVNFRSFASNRIRLSEHKINYSETKTEDFGSNVLTFDYSVALMKYDTIQPKKQND